MAVLPLKIAPDPVLRARAKRVRVIDRSIHRLIDNMLDTMHHHGGVGLAANQVGVLLRVIVIHIPEEEPLFLVNPQIISRQGEREVEEGCLSIPGYRGKITRSVTVRAKAIRLAQGKAPNREAREIRLKADDLLAQVLEHEMDHLNGTLYIDHIHDLNDPSHFWKLEPEEEAVEAAAAR